MINEEICSKCPIYNDNLYQLGIRKTYKVEPRYIHNNGKQRILICCEAPGKDEDYQNLTLVGRAGKLLDSLLIESGLTNYNIRLSNPVKCRPIEMVANKDKNRAPTDEELYACSFYMKEDMAFDPQLIILLGRIPFKAFFPEKEPAAFRGKGLLYKYADKEIMTLLSYHPAACLYNASNRPTLLKHLTNAVSYLEQLQEVYNGELYT
jgi:uracil-DNA glycosylase family 4